jgi:hypothetical protein
MENAGSLVFLAIVFGSDYERWPSDGGSCTYQWWKITRLELFL